MQYKKVARIQEEISAIGIGCWNFGGDWDSSDEQEAIRIVHAAVDQGVNFFDVAPVYGWGKAETVLGCALAGGKREKVIIASKCGLLWNEQHKTRNDLSRASILHEIDDSLRRLQTDYIDIYQLHWPDPKVPLEEIADTLAQLKKAGKIRYVGLSNFSKKDVETFDSMTTVHSVQGLYNMLERNASSYHRIPLEYRVEKEIFPLVQEKGMAFLPYSPMFQGLLAGCFQKGITFSSKDVRHSNPKLMGEQFKTYRQAAEAVKDFAQQIGKPMCEVNTNWLRQKQQITSIIGGVSSVQQLCENVHALEWELTAEQMAQLEMIIAPYAKPEIEEV